VFEELLAVFIYISLNAYGMGKKDARKFAFVYAAANIKLSSAVG
jgi:hypothetical protein